MLLEYQLDWIKIVDFLLMAKFSAGLLFFASPSNKTVVQRLFVLETVPLAFAQ